MLQNRAPLFEALKKYVDDDVVPFHVPGHKRGKGLNELADYLGGRVFEIDVNGMEDLDNICNPIGVIKEAEALLADLFGADDSFYLVNGTSQGVQSMILAATGPGHEVILPRNAHKSTVGGMILSGAIPVYVQPEIDKKLGIAMGMTVESVKRAIDKHPHASAVFVINPTYYGMTSDLEKICQLAHENDMLVLVDEAHGSHLSFSDSLPLAGMQAGADMSAISLHKTGGSMTQSSALLIRKSEKVASSSVKSAINLTQTTSASYVLMASIDVARRQLALNGKSMIKNAIDLANYARDKINMIPGLHAFGKEMEGLPGVFGFDPTKLSIHVRKLGMSGYQMESLLRKKYNIQIELSDLYNIMAIVTLGDRQKDLDALVAALKDISQNSCIVEEEYAVLSPIKPKLVVSPRDAHYSPKKTVKLEDASGEISGEMIMAYPPGIPVILPGEKYSKEIIEYVNVLKQEKTQLQGTEDPFVDYVNVLGEAY